MSVVTPLVKPAQSPVKIDPTAKALQESGFNFPTLRLLNKLARSTFSKPYDLSTNTRYHILAVSNTKGWFAAARFNGSSYGESLRFGPMFRVNGFTELVFSTLEDLRASQKGAKSQGSNDIAFKRTIPLPQGKPNILSLANHDSCLLVGLEQGVVAVYDTSVVFTPGQVQIQPTHTQQLQSSALKQIAANPGTEPLVAVVGEGSVQVLNMRLEPQAGWAASDAITNPVAVAWSPKGKHLAIGLQTGDILTYALNNATTVNKHIPPTFDGALVGLNWTGPGHSFQTSYSPGNDPNPGLHIVCLDTKTNTGTYWNAIYPWVQRDTMQPSPYLVQLPKWDNDDHKSLFVFGDSIAADIEVVAHDKQAWYQDNPDNKPACPLTEDQEDTILLSLDLDLTEISTATPLVFACLNDGTMLSYHLEYQKPYPNMVTPGDPVAPIQTPGAIQTDASMSTEQDRAPTSSLAAFSQPAASGAFGQSSFGSSSFGAPSFGNPSFGKTTATGTTGGIFSSFASGTSAFGQAAAQQPPGMTSAFGGASTTPVSSPFGGGGSFGGSGSPFSGSSTGAFGSTNTTPAFGQTASGNNATGSAFGAAAANPPADMTREASMADATPGFGGMGLGASNNHSDNDSKPSIFGNTAGASTSATFGSSSGGGLIKPSSGFGFAASSGSPFAKAAQQGTYISSLDQSQAPSGLSHAPALTSAANTGSGFGTSGFGQSSFGQPSFGQSSLGKPAFGQSAFGQSSFGSATPATSPAPSSTSGGFGAFANKSISFGATVRSTPTPAAAAGTSPPPITSSSTPSAFGGANTEPAKSAFSSINPTVSSFAAGSSQPAFGTTSAFGSLVSKPGTSMFGTFGAPVTPEKSKDASGIASPSSSPEATPAAKPSSEAPASPSTKSAFGNLQTSSSSLRPAQGFGAFATTVPSDSPFAKKPAEQKASAPVSVFASLAASGGTSVGPSPGTAFPAFGAPSALGAGSSFGAPVTPTTPTATPPKALASGGFAGFSGSPSPFSAFTKSGGSFTDLLKQGAEPKGAKDVGDAAGKEKEKEKVKAAATEEEIHKPASSGSSASLAGDASFGDISSAGSSFVDVRAEGKEEEEAEQGEEDDDDEHDPDYVPSEEDELSDDHEYDDEEEDDLPLDEEQEEEGEEESIEPAKVPLPRSGSSTPVPEIKLDRTQSNTPPGSPDNQPSPPAQSPSPTATSPSPPFSGLGIGRPSTQPKRSSPLATAPVSRNDEEEDQKPPPTPKPAAAVLPGKASVDRAPDDAKKSISPPFPPTFGQPANLFGAPKTVTPPAAAGSVPSSLFGTPSTGPKPTSLPVPFSITPTSPPAPPVGFFSLKPQGTSALSGTTGGSPAATPFSLPAFSISGAATTKIPEPPSSLFGQPAPPASFGSFLGNPAAANKQGSGFFASPPNSTSSAPSATPLSGQVPAFSLGGASLFGNNNPPLAGGPFGQQQPLNLAPKLPVPQPIAPKSESAPPPEMSMEEGMQKECALLILTLEAELEELGNKVQQVNQRKEHLSKTAGGSWNRPDLGDSGKWSLGDIKQFGQVLVKFSDDLASLKEQREQIDQEIRTLKSGMLKANTRREEIARFNKAKTDPEFAKMLKTRTLGPEHSETQTQLRRGIRTMRDRIQKLESNLQASKKKLAEASSGKPHIKAPTLDTVNRTFRNIEIALGQQSNDVNLLAARLRKVDLNAPSTPSAPLRDTRLPDRQRRAYNVTPNVAATTAAALNAERGANRLKKALLAVRKEPLLNTNVNAAKPPRVATSPERSFKPNMTPLKSTTSPPALPVTPIPFSLPVSFPKFNEAEAGPPDNSAFTLPPDDEFSLSMSLPSQTTGRRGGSAKKHSSVQLPKKSPGTPSPAPSFDWGPLPTFNTPTKGDLPASFTKK